MKKRHLASIALTAAISVASFGGIAEASYTVKSGDSLWKISQSQKTTVGNITKWNKLKSTTIYPGQTLQVSNPTKSSNKEISYVVKKGDSLFKIAKKHKTTVAKIKSDNKLKSDMILIGQKLKVTSNTSVVAPKAPSVPKEQLATTHKVQSGDSLFKIAKKHKTTISDIKRLNKLNSDMIYPGQDLKVTEGSLPAPKAPSFLANGQFPLPEGQYTAFGDTWGDSRSYGGDRAHEGTDIMAKEGTPIYSATAGTIVRIGWNELGGYRISIKTPEGYNLYYAHMSKYASGMTMGATIKKGQHIGNVGSTGYGPEGTSGKFDPHLHFGMYDSSWKAMNAYSHLKYWESK